MKFGTEYLSPAYYDKLLKKYSSGDVSTEDVQILTSFIQERPDNPNVLELGCGSGRATQIIASDARFQKFTVIDLSKQMLDFVKAQNLPITTYQNIDHLKYLQETEEKFDLVVSLWSLAHSVFPWYAEHGSSVFGIIESILSNFFEKNLNNDGRVFIIQTDGASEEQALIKRSWFLGNRSSNLETTYYKDLQSPSVWILKDVFKKLTESEIFDRAETKIEHIQGEDIEYNSIDEALEIFMNFHLESEFNGTAEFDAVYSFLRVEFEKIIAAKGKLAIGTGFWIYRAQRI